MNLKKIKKVGAFIDVINGSFIITLSILLFGILAYGIGVKIKPLINYLIISLIYVLGIYTSRNSLMSAKKMSFKNRFLTNILLVLLTTLFQFLVLNYTGYWFLADFTHLILINIIFVFVLGTIFHYSLRLLSKSKSV